MQTLIVSGASSGIGQATAQLFAQRGYRVYDLSRSGKDREGIRHIYCDVTDNASCLSAVEQVIDECGRIDICLCNAGMGISGSIEFTDIQEVQRLMDINFYGALRLTQAVLPYMRGQRSGKIFFTSSMAAILPLPYQSFYSASKAAINAVALSLQNEVQAFGIRVACLLPGDVYTGFTAERRKSEKGADIYTSTQRAVSKMEWDEEHGMRPEQMARKFWRMAQQKRPWLYNTVGLQYQFFCFLHKILPVSLVNWIEGKMYC